MGRLSLYGESTSTEGACMDISSTLFKHAYLMVHSYTCTYTNLDVIWSGNIKDFHIFTLSKHEKCRSNSLHTHTCTSELEAESGTKSCSPGEVGSGTMSCSPGEAGSGIKSCSPGEGRSSFI